MNDEIILRTKKTKRNKKIKKIFKIILLIILLFLVAAYFIAKTLYNSGTFTIRLDKDLYLKNGIIIYDDPTYKPFRSELYAEPLDFMDNISYKWLAEDIGEHDGSHNGENYIAYTFYIENAGETGANYWYEILIDNVIKNVDEAIRIRVYKNGEEVTYAKIAANNKPEPGTVSFLEENLVLSEKQENFKPGDIDKYTIVIWLEGSDPECTNNILGGEIKMHMQFNSEQLKKEKEND